jgi:hypothetical protein
VKTTISALGYADFSEWFIGHSGSTYWTKKDSEKAEIFCKIEPYLTFLNIPQPERQGTDIQSKVEEYFDSITDYSLYLFNMIRIRTVASNLLLWYNNIRN